VHLWVRAEQRAGEQRVGITPSAVADLIARGFRVTVEQSPNRAIPIDGFRASGADIAAEGTWPQAPSDSIIFGLKEIPTDGSPLGHRHIMFGHAFKGQSDGPDLLRRFKAGGGTLYDLEYLTDEQNRRVAAFGYWAGFAGAAVGLKVWTAQQQPGAHPGPERIETYASKDALVREIARDLTAPARNDLNAIIIGALGRVGTGASDLFAALDVPVTRWDMAETSTGGPFPEILDHTILVNCVLAGRGIPVFVPKSALHATRRLRVIADVSCDPSSDFNPIPVYSHATSFAAPVIRVADSPAPLDVTAIDNLPSMLPVESSQDFAAQLLPTLRSLDQIETGVWGRAEKLFRHHVKGLA